ncbi:MAG TPA: hypothetical protein VK527_05645 [Candidatus Limnocylindrales bacterium]|jgi:hypothetical protein|nr:hypothetical protein [Candidatus Limnocylindrales bacterium]
MKRHGWTILALGLGLMTAGCILTSGQIQISFDLPSPFTANSVTGIDGTTIDLNTESEYQDNKDKLKDLSDLAVLGKFTNNAATAVNVEVWMTPAATSHLTEAALRGDPTAIKLWGPFQVGPNATTVIDWNKSAALFTTAGKATLLAQAKGDGEFSIYAVGPAGAAYNFTVENGALVLVIDVGI